MPATRSTRAAVPPRGPAGRIDDGGTWQHRAACLTEDPELFFPVGTTGPALWQAEEAKAVCRRCPVLGPCLAWALESRVEHGVWGGRTEEERRSLRRRQGRTSRFRPTG